MFGSVKSLSRTYLLLGVAVVYGALRLVAHLWADVARNEEDEEGHEETDPDVNIDSGEELSATTSCTTTTTVTSTGTTTDGLEDRTDSKDESVHIQCHFTESVQVRRLVSLPPPAPVHPGEVIYKEEAVRRIDANRQALPNKTSASSHQSGAEQEEADGEARGVLLLRQHEHQDEKSSGSSGMTRVKNFFKCTCQKTAAK